jgi:GNAT superfamily N-acetyltransferase
MEDVTIITCCGEEIFPYLDAAARLRIEVFREYPYLYEGTAGYEREYLTSYGQSRESVFVCALVGGQVVGVSTALPLKDADVSFQAPFQRAGAAVEEIYYLGESVLLPAYRGRGIGHAFFDRREQRARELGYRVAAFCSVLRPDAHALRPPGYRDHNVFWHRRGYQPTGLIAELAWQQIDATEEVMNRLEFWQRLL